MSTGNKASKTFLSIIIIQIKTINVNFMLRQVTNGKGSIIEPKRKLYSNVKGLTIFSKYVDFPLQLLRS